MRGSRAIRRLAARSFALALPALAIWGAGCEWLIPGDPGNVHCTDEGAVGPPACDVGLTCKAGLCTTSAIGVECASDVDCAQGDFCFDPAIAAASGPKRCSHACCTSSDCDPDGRLVCAILPNGGGSVCRPAAELGRAMGGAKKPLEACRHPADCRSGSCIGGLCMDTCCSDTSCAAGGGACRYGQPILAEAAGFWCALPITGMLPRYAACKSNDECASGLCIDLGNGPPMRCSAPCCGSDVCEMADGLRARCVQVEVSPTASVRACGGVRLGVTGAGEVGEACASDGDCRSAMCVEQGGTLRCTDTCCSDASCGDPSSFACRPTELADAWALRCAPK